MTLRILMVQTPTSHLGAGERVYPLGLSRLAGLAALGADVCGLDMNLQPDPWPILGQTLLEVQPAVVMLSFRNLDPLAGHHASYLSGLKTAARMVRRVTPDARILAGGPAFTLFAKRLMQAVPELDGGVIGEGEPAMPGLLAHPFQPQTTPGLIWRRVDGRIQRNRPASPPVDMDALPEMDIQRFRPEDYLRGNAYVAAVGIEGKRGCDLGCGYCVYPFLGGCTMRVRKPKQIVDEMQRLHDKCGSGEAVAGMDLCVATCADAWVAYGRAHAFRSSVSAGRVRWCSIFWKFGRWEIVCIGCGHGAGTMDLLH